MSRDAAEDGRPDVAEDIEPAAMASESAESGQEPLDPDEAVPPAEHASAPWDDTRSAWDDPVSAPGADDVDADDLSANDPGYGAPAAGHHDAAGEDADVDAVPGSLLEMAEPVELSEPSPLLPPPRRWPRLLLAFGFVLLAVAIVGGAVAIVGSVTHGFKKPVKVTYTTSPVFSLKTGDCIDPQGQTYTLISCDSPHKAEVFATFGLTGTAWPGSAKVAAAASSGCASRLTRYLNPQLAVSLASTYVYPDATAWQAGTRTVICEVRAASGELTGSVRGASATAG
jgi:hypothetical protein